MENKIEVIESITKRTVKTYTFVSDFGVLILSADDSDEALETLKELVAFPSMWRLDTLGDMI